jgi:hypothetical protein
LYDYANELVKRVKKIYSPYNVITHWRVKTEDYFDDPDSVEFKNWQYTLTKSLWKVRYEQQLEWLWFYNPIWWSLSKWDALLHQRHMNWRYFKNDWIHVVKMEKIATWPVIKTETITERVEVQQIPAIIAEWLNVLQLKSLATAWGIELQEDLLTWDSDNYKKVIMKVMEESWHISK